MSDPADPSVTSSPKPAPDRSQMGLRLVHLILISLLIGAGVAVLHVLTIVQFLVMLIDKGQKNDQIADFGQALGAWLGKAARFQTGQSDQKPWPWSPLE